MEVAVTVSLNVKVLSLFQFQPKMYSFKLILAVCCVAVGFLVCAKGYLLKGPSWCDRDLCPNGGRHIACNNDGVYEREQLKCNCHNSNAKHYL